MTMSVLFMCPHAAGKSLLAATYFRAAAARAGLDVSINVAGPEPDQHNMANVQASLESQGYTIDWEPQLVTNDDTDNADVLVSVGCDHNMIPTAKTITEWDVPMLSDDFPASMHAIHQFAESLATELSAVRVPHG